MATYLKIENPGVQGQRALCVALVIWGDLRWRV